MKININSNLAKLINQENIKVLIKIIKIGSNFSEISISGKKLKIPFVLNKDARYYATVKDNQLYIIKEEIPKKITKDEFINKIDKKLKESDKKLDSLFMIDEKKDKIIENLIKCFPFQHFYSKINKNKDDNKGNYYFLRNDKEDSYIFIFNIPFYDNYTRIFLKIERNKAVFIEIFRENGKELNIESFLEDLNNKLKKYVKNLVVNITDNKDDFYNRINYYLIDKKVDLNI